MPIHQEYDDLNSITNFYTKLEQNIVTAKMVNCFIFIEMDANAKLGNDFINKTRGLYLKTPDQPVQINSVSQIKTLKAIL